MFYVVQNLVMKLIYKVAVLKQWTCYYFMLGVINIYTLTLFKYVLIELKYLKKVLYFLLVLIYLNASAPVYHYPYK